MNIRRAKQPAAVRLQILEAARHVLADEGAGALTFDSVLARTDLSKGGIQYHFRTKHALMDGLFDHLMQEFAAALHDALAAEPAGADQHIRTYIKVVSQAAESMTAGREAMALLMADPKYQAIHTELVDDFCSPDDVAADLSLSCRFAVEGLWQAQVLLRAPRPEVVASVRDCLLGLLDNAAEPGVSSGGKRALPR
jgi:AcrR family transcriptional regulator